MPPVRAAKAAASTAPQTASPLQERMSNNTLAISARLHFGQHFEQHRRDDITRHNLHTEPQGCGIQADFSESLHHKAKPCYSIVKIGCDLTKSSNALMRIKIFKGAAAERWGRRICQFRIGCDSRNRLASGCHACKCQIQSPCATTAGCGRTNIARSHGMGNVENNRQVAASLFHHAETEHKDNEVVIAEAAAAFA